LTPDDQSIREHPDLSPAPEHRPASSRAWVWPLWACAAAGFAIAAAFLLRPGSPEPEPIVSKPLTRDGRQKSGPLVTDGINVYFRETTTPPLMVLSSVPVEGGESTLVSIPLHEPVSVRDLFGDASSFVVLGYDSQFQARFWNWAPNRFLKPLEPTTEHAWRLSATAQADIREGRLFIREQGRPERVIPIPGTVSEPAWQRDKKILRFTVIDPGKESFAIWQMTGLDGIPAPVRGYPKHSFDGRWNATGDIFAFRSTERPDRDIDDIWIADERAPASSENPRLVHLTKGPISYSTPVAAPDGRQVFALGFTQKPELIRYDTNRSEWLPYLGGMDGFETELSRNGQWLVFVRYPERTLWKMRANGTERTQLTFAPFQAIQPQWSPDGRQIALMGQWPGGHHLIYLISADGGQPKSLINEPADQGIPTWSADGSKLVFGELLSNSPRSEMSLHVVDIKTQRQWVLPNSKGMWTPRWSPDGLSIAALSSQSNALYVYNTRTGLWRSLVNFPFIESPTWTTDSRQLYFKTADHDIEGSPDFLVQRLDVESGTVTRVADLTGIETSTTGWYGLTRDGSPLTLRNTRTIDIYSISVPADRWR